MKYNHKTLPDSFHRIVLMCKPFKILFASISMLLLIVAIFTNTVSATEVQRTGSDLHQLWDKTCLGCHGHSAEFSRTFLKVVDGQLQGPLHKETFRLFIQNHYLAGKEVDSVYSMLLAQANTKPRFKQECSGCHKSAAEFIRESLVLRDGVLYSRKFETPTRGFLDTHRGLKQEDVEFFTKQLTRLAEEIYRP